MIASRDFDNYEKNRQKQWTKEHKAGGFKCSHCKNWVVINDFMGTINRNHCNICLWSRHVDENKGDRRAQCCAGMKPVGLTFKHEGWGRQGEIMLIHVCSECPKLSINRIAADDSNELIMSIFEASFAMPEGLRRMIEQKDIYVMAHDDYDELHAQLFGK